MVTKAWHEISGLPLQLFYKLVGMAYGDDDRLEDRLGEYFPTYRAAFGEAANQSARILGRTQAYEVQGVVIEPTNACNLLCRHCTTQRIPNDTKGLMSLDLFRRIVDENPQLTCIILTRNGEPLVHKQLFEMVRIARARNIHVNIYTNGMLLGDHNIPEIFESDLSEINFSMEGVGDYFEYNRGKPYEAIASVITRVLEERERRGSKLRVGINATAVDDVATAQGVVDEWGKRVNQVSIEPLMGKEEFRRTTSCRTLWRNLVVTWDGKVLPCCFDMYGTLVLGNANEKPLREIFNSAEVQAFRKQHLDGNFPKVCSFCPSYYG